MRPDVPEWIAHLNCWIHKLHGRSGLAVNALGATVLAPLTYTAIKDWAFLMGESLDPWEIEALVELDGILMNPESAEHAKSQQDAEAQIIAPKRAWPTKKPVSSEAT